MAIKKLMRYKTLDDFNFYGKTVLVRVDFNVPLTSAGEIADEQRLIAHIPTIQELINAKARVVLASHLGRPRGNDEVFSLRKVATRFTDLLSHKVGFVDDCIGEKVNTAVGNMKNGEVLLLENLRFHQGEEFNDEKFISQLADLAEIYLNDAFATAHRKHASTYGVPAILEHKGIGRLMERELKILHKTIDKPCLPLVVIVGGAKVSTKIHALENIITKASTLIVGGAMANTFLAALNHEMGNSMYEPDFVETARKVISDAGACGCRIILPSDIVVADQLLENTNHKNIAVDKISPTAMALDTGEKTLETWHKVIKNAGAVLWNGPIGAFEVKPFHQGTFKLIKALAETDAFTVVGGGDTLHAISKAGFNNKDFDHVCTGGGALLRFLEGNELVALEVLRD